MIHANTGLTLKEWLYSHDPFAGPPRDLYGCLLLSPFEEL